PGAPLRPPLQCPVSPSRHRCAPGSGSRLRPGRGREDGEEVEAIYTWLVRPRSAILLVLFLSGCGSSAGKPLSAVDGYVAALRASDFSRAYDFIAERYRRDPHPPPFGKRIAQGPRQAK